MTGWRQNIGHLNSQRIFLSVILSSLICAVITGIKLAEIRTNVAERQRVRITIEKVTNEHSSRLAESFSGANIRLEKRADRESSMRNLTYQYLADILRRLDKNEYDRWHLTQSSDVDKLAKKIEATLDSRVSTAINEAGSGAALAMILIIVSLLMALKTDRASGQTTTSEPSIERREPDETERQTKDIVSNLQKASQTLSRSLVGLDSVSSVVAQSAVALVATNESGVITFVNNAAVVLFGQQSGKMTGQHINQWLDVRLVASETYGSLLETECRLGNDKSIPVEVHINKLQGKNGLRFVLNIVDVSNRFELMRMRKDVLGELSHDLRSPIASISLLLSMLKEGRYGTMPGNAVSAIALVTPELDRLIRLTDSLLCADALEDGRVRLSVAFVAPETLIEQSFVAAKGLTESRNQKLILDSAYAGSVYGDGERLVQVLVNLVTNASKFSPRESEIICRIEQSGSELRFEVIDEGIGISDADAANLFEKFERGQQSVLQTAPGTGVGLWICKRIVEMHGGSIGAQRRTTVKGTVFWFTIPLVYADELDCSITTTIESGQKIG
jgi:PAS domain S-box-containing protein